MKNMRLMAAVLMAGAAMPSMGGDAVVIPGFGYPTLNPRRGAAGSGRRSQESYRAEQRRKARGNPAGTKLGKAAHEHRYSRGFADTFLASLASKRITKAACRDEHGAYVCVGPEYEVEGMAPDPGRECVFSSWVHGEDMGYTARRKWLAGVSEQRGY